MVTLKNSLRAHLEEQVRHISEHPEDAVREPRVETKLIDNLMAVSEFEQHGKNHTFISDEAEWNGGDGRGPTPLRYFLSGIGFCQQVWYAKCAALRGIPIESLEISVGALLDIRGELGIEGYDPALGKINLETRIRSTASSEEVLRLRNMVNSRCPVFNTLRKGTPVMERLVQNGQLISEGPV